MRGRSSDDDGFDDDGGDQCQQLGIRDSPFLTVTLMGISGLDIYTHACRQTWTYSIGGIRMCECNSCIRNRERAREGGTVLST